MQTTNVSIALLLVIASLILVKSQVLFTGCGGTREGPSGAIVSPNYPSSYPNNARCNWTITAQTNEIIDLRFTSLDLEGYVDSCEDDVKVYDGENHRAYLMQQLCRYKEKTELDNIDIRSTGNKMHITFYSNGINQRRGFLATYSTHVCPPMTYGKEICNETCNCIRENTAFCNNLDGTCQCKSGWGSIRCEVDINECADPKVETCPVDYEVCVNKQGSFSCECRPGLVKNTFGNCAEKPNTNCALGCSHLCGVTDDKVEHCYCPDNMTLNGVNCVACPPLTYGKNCEFACPCNVDHTTTCNRATGQCNCAHGWTSANCSVDVDECDLSRSLNTCQEVPNQICVNTIGSYRCDCFAGFEVKTAGGRCEKKGCDYTIVTSPSIIQTKDYPTRYWPNAVCSWLIQADISSTISVEFSDFETESNFDYVYIYDGPNSNSELLWKFSGSQRFQEPIRSTTNNMFIRFQADGSIEGRGFNGTYTQSAYPQGCRYSITAPQLSQTTIGTDLTSGNPSLTQRIFCIWFISAPSDSIISINLVAVATEQYCKSVVAVYTLGLNGATVFHGRYCGATSPGVLRVAGHKAIIVYQSEEDSPRYGFQARINYCSNFYYGTDLCTTPCPCVQGNSLSCDSLSGRCNCNLGWGSENCGVDVDECVRRPCSLTQRCINTPGSYTCQHDCTSVMNGPLGEISTVQYPGYSLEYAQCEWIIKGGVKDAVSLSISTGNFHLIESAMCAADSLDIYNGEVNATHHMGKYCGNKIPSLIRSTANTMILRLRTSGGIRLGFTGVYRTHECSQFTWGDTCQKPCSCDRDKTRFCDNVNGFCVCKDGWTGQICSDDINECRTASCPENHICENTPGSFLCTCRPGFVISSDGKCEGKTENCINQSNKTCSHFCTTNDLGQVTCLCPEGMEIGAFDYMCVVALYPFGEANGDLTRSKDFLKIADKSYGEIKFGTEVTFGEQTVKSAYIHNSGVISLENFEVSASPSNDPSKLLIETFWANMNHINGEVYYHLYEKCEPSVFLESESRFSPKKLQVMERAAKDVMRLASVADFDVNLVLVVTWTNASSVTSNLRNTFQAVFISGNQKQTSTDLDFSTEETTYVQYIYPKDKMLWCHSGVQIGVCAGKYTYHIPGINYTWIKRFQETQFYKVGQKRSPAQQCQRYVCKNSRLITNPVYRQEIGQLYKCPCTLDRLGLQWTLHELRSPNIYCYSISQVAKRRLLSSNPRNKLCCYKWDRPTTNDWRTWANQRSLATFIHNSPDAGHVVPADPGLYGFRENVDARQWCCQASSNDRLCQRFNKIYPDMECSYDVQFVPGYLLGDPTIVTLDNFTYLMNGWNEYSLMDIPSEKFVLQARTERIQTSTGLSNGTVFSAFAAKDSYGTHFQVELSESKNSMEILASGLNLTDGFMRQEDYRFSTDDIEVLRENNGNMTRVVVSFPCGVSMMVRVGVQNLELEMQVLKTLQNKTRGLLGNFNGEIDDEFTLPNGTVLPANLTEKDIFYKFASEYEVKVNNSVFIYKPGKKAADYRHPSFVPRFLDSEETSELTAATAICGTGRTSCIYDYLITHDSIFAKNTDNIIEQSFEKRLTLANSCPKVTIANNNNYINSRWYVQEGVVNTLRLVGSDEDNDVLTYLLNANDTGLLIEQSGYLNYTPNVEAPVNIGFRIKDSKNCYTPVVNIYTNICPQCRNNGWCNRNETRDVEYFGGHVQILKCECSPGYTGANCESELDACLSKPCAKGKNCTDLTAALQGNSTVGYVCGPCPRGYIEIKEVCVDIDECENNSTCEQLCENTESSFTCACNEGYILNRTDSKSCLAKNCSGRCVMENTLYCDESISVCVCRNDVKTIDCSLVLDYCVSSPCPTNRKCINRDAGFVCTCMNGLTPINGSCKDCNRILTESSGSFMSSNYPDNYPDGESCTWTITSNESNSVILLNITDYHVEGCPQDYIQVYDGLDFESTLIGYFCSDTGPILTSSTGSSMLIYFTSDDSMNKRGFFATYVVESTCKIKKCSHDCKLVSASPRVEQCLCPEWLEFKDETRTNCTEINACNTTVKNNIGLIVSPGYPQKYQANVSCHWTIPSKSHAIVSISFTDVEIEGGVSCQYDSLKIYNGTSTSYPLLGVYCGSSLPRSISSTNSLYLVFTSDGLISGRGFKLRYNYRDLPFNQTIFNAMEVS